jgi:uncharacterized damage-inducible protein DinB
MDLLDRLLGHDAWTTRELLLRCRALTDAQLDREFDIGPRTVRATLRHIVLNVGVWTDLMAGKPPRARPIDSGIDSLLAWHEAAAADLAALARDVAARGAWDETFADTLDVPPMRKPIGGGIAHVITHSMHHRAQVLYMLRRLGLTEVPEGDELTWEMKIRRA